MVDNMELPFNADEDLIGAWKYYNFIKYPAKFSLLKRKWKSDRVVAGLYFEQDGLGKINYCAPHKMSQEIKWTKGHILNTKEGFDMLYTIDTKFGKKYLLMEWKSGDYLYRNEIRGYYVFKKEA